MSIATAFSSGLNSYMKVKDYKQKQELRDLQKEGHSLRNEGYRLGNRFERQTFDDRVGTVAANRRSADFKAEQEETAAFVSNAVAPHKISKAEFDSLGSEQAYYTEQQRTRYMGNSANEAGTNARVAADTAASDVSATNAQNRRDEFQANREVLEDQQEEIATYLEASGGNWGEVFNNGVQNGRLVGLARESYGVNVTDFDQLSDGSIAVYVDDGDEPAQVMSEDEFTSVFVDTDSLVESIGRTAQNQGAQQVVNQQVGGAKQEHVGDVKNAGRQRTGIQSALDAIPTFDELGDERLRLRGRIYTLEQRKVRGFGEATTNAPLNEEISELESELEGVESNLSDLRDTHGDLLNSDPQDLERADQALASQLNNQGEVWQRTLSDIGGVAGEARRTSRATLGQEGDNRLTPEQTMANAFSDNSSDAFTKTRLEQAQERADMVDAGSTVTDAVDDTMERGAEKFEAAAQSDSDGDFEKYSKQDVQAAGDSVRNALFDNDAAVRAATGAPGQRLRTSALVNISMQAGLESGAPAGTFMTGFLAGNNPASITAAAEFADEEALSKVGVQDRPAAVQTVIRLMEQGDESGNQYNATQAKTAVLQMINGGAFN